MAVVVLAGGEGRRMGGGKPLRLYGRTTLVDNALNLARQWSDEVAVAVRRADQVPDLLARAVFDPPQTPGPAAGLQAALAYGLAQRAEAVLTLPCDAPRLPTDLADRLAAALQGGARCAIAASGGRRHPTCGLWRPDLERDLARYVECGGRSLRGFVEEMSGAVVEWPHTGGPDPFANANTPGELAALQPTL